MDSGSETQTPGADESLAVMLGGCRSLFPPALLAADGWERCMQLAASMPRAAIETFGFEFHLGMAAPRADMGTIVWPGSDVARHYVGLGERSPSGSPAAALASCLRAQSADPDSYFADSVAGVVLEYDLARLAPHQPVAPPGIFLSPRRDAPGTRPDFHEHGEPARLLGALAAIAGWSGYQAVLRPYERVLAALPESGYVFQAGALPGRSARAFRVLILGVAAADVPAVLNRLRWPGSTAAVEALFAAMGDRIAYVALSLDVTARGPGARLGVELFGPCKWFQVDRTSWPPIIARLVEQGWCVPAKADGLRAWPGTERMFTDSGEIYVVRQGINHVKVVIDRAAPTVAKAYVGMDMRPVSAHGRSARAKS